MDDEEVRRVQAMIVKSAEMAGEEAPEPDLLAFGAKILRGEVSQEEIAAYQAERFAELKREQESR